MASNLAKNGDGPKVAILHGMAGSGKTDLCVQFAKKLRQQYGLFCLETFK
jgi:tRNA A37 threonylcarbamoyladenosine biosynthesis protein TsaE